MQKKDLSLSTGTIHSLSTDSSNTDMKAIELPDMSYEEFLEAASGPVNIPMTNDYLFRAVFQTNNYVLKGLICSLLHLKPVQVRSVEVTNPIILGNAAKDKEFILDIRVELNKNTVLNLELQVVDEHNWPERSLSYLCRAFDNLNEGDEYIDVKSAIQISFLDFTLFPDAPEFYATYKFLNVKTFKIYSDKIRLSVVDLRHINLATEEDKSFRIDEWAGLFKATTWEEIKMLAKENDFLKEASKAYYQLSLEERIRQECEAREEFHRRQRTAKRWMEIQQARLEEQQAQLEEQQSQLEQQQTLLEEQQSQLEEQKAQMEEQKAQMEEQKAQMEDTQVQLEEKSAAFAALQAEYEALKAQVNPNA